MKSKKNERTGKLLLIVGIAVGVLLLITIGLLFRVLVDSLEARNVPTVTVYDSRQPAPADSTAQTQESQTESSFVQDDMVLVTMEDFVFCYPYAFSDILQMEEKEVADGYELIFTARLEENEFPLYRLCFHTGEGTAVGTLTSPTNGESIKVSVVVEEAPADLPEDHRLAFLAAQETLNDVLMSLSSNENFIPAG